MGFFNNFSNNTSVRAITPEEAKHNLETNKKIVLVDVREDYEFNAGHIQNAKNLPVGNIANTISSVVKDPGTPLYVYCKSGARSSRACQVLVAKGYTNVYNLGGIMTWPYDVVR